MKTRNFLNDVVIVGAMLVSRCGTILHYSLPNLLKWCDWVLIMFDNESEESVKIIMDYKKKYPGRIRIAHSGFPRATEKEEEARELKRKEKGSMFRRYRAKQGLLKDEVFKHLRKLYNDGEKIDLLIFSDSDEVFNDMFPEVLERFWGMKNKRAIAMKPVAVFDSMKIIKKHSMAPHVRVLRYATDFTAVPRQGLCNFIPLTKKDRIANRFVMVHLHSLLPDKRKWRNAHWKTTYMPDDLLWKLEDEVWHVNPKVIRETFEKEPYMNVKEYLETANQKI